MGTKTLRNIAQGIARTAEALRSFHIAQAFARWSSSMAVMDAPGHPIYERNVALRFGPRDVSTKAGDNEALFTQNVDQAALPGAPVATTEGHLTEGAGALRLLWRDNDGGTPANVSFRVWVKTGALLGWAILRDYDNVEANTEVRIPDPGYRRVYLQVTAVGGAPGAGTFDVWLAAEG